MQNSNSPPTIDGLDNKSAFELIGDLIDQSISEIKPVLADHAIGLLDSLETRALSSGEKALADYFRANAWDAHHQQRVSDKTAIWDFEVPELRKKLLHLRRAANGAGFAEIETYRQCQVLTNLGNTLLDLGRFVDAIPLWNQALAIKSKFWMANANLGITLMTYGLSLYEFTDQAILAYYAHQNLLLALTRAERSKDPADAPIAENLARRAAHIARNFDLQAIQAVVNESSSPVGKSKAERSYRNWVASNSLFLNPLNDVERVMRPRLAQDSLRLPDFVTEISTPPIVVGMFNELKQGFLSARYLYWEGVTTTVPHFSDRKAPLFSTMDYTSHGLALEKVKLAFRVAYSLFDKIAYFLNHYLVLQIPEKRVSFRSLWRDEKAKGNPIKPAFNQSENWPLRGLFWLGEDLYADDLKEQIEPDVRALAELRNHLEHKYVKIHEFQAPKADPADPFFDHLAHSVERGEFERKTLRLLRLSRSALIYLVLAMHREEIKRKKAKAGRTAPMQLVKIDDRFKR